MALSKGIGENEDSDGGGVSKSSNMKGGCSETEGNE